MRNKGVSGLRAIDEKVYNTLLIFILFQKKLKH